VEQFAAPTRRLYKRAARPGGGSRNIRRARAHIIFLRAGESCDAERAVSAPPSAWLDRSGWLGRRGPASMTARGMRRAPWRGGLAARALGAATPPSAARFGYGRSILGVVRSKSKRPGTRIADTDLESPAASCCYTPNVPSSSSSCTPLASASIAW